MPQETFPLTDEQARDFINLAMQMTVSNVWLGYGEPLFLEFGPLNYRTTKSRIQTGDVTLFFSGLWRVIRDDHVIHEFFNDRKADLDQMKKDLIGLRLLSYNTERIQENIVSFTFDQNVCVEFISQDDEDDEYHLSLHNGKFAESFQAFRMSDDDDYFVSRSEGSYRLSVCYA